AAQALCRDLGISLPDEVFQRVEITTPFGAASTAAGQVLDEWMLLRQAFRAGAAGDIALHAALVLDKIASLNGGLKGIGHAFVAIAGSVPGVPPSRLQQFGAGFVKAVIDDTLLFDWEVRHPGRVAALLLLGLATREQRFADPGDATTIDHTARSLTLQPLTGLLTDPAKYLRDTYGLAGTLQ